MKKCLAVVVMMMCAPLVRGATEGVTFAERYALAEDRVAVLAELIPGTDDFFFYHALHAQNTANTQEARNFLNQWIAKYPNGGRNAMPEVERKRYDGLDRRQIILELNPRNLDFGNLRRALGDANERVGDHAPAPEDAVRVELRPTSLDQGQITFEAYLGRRNFTDHLRDAPVNTLEYLITRPLNAEQRQIVLKRLEHPNLPNLVTLIAQDLAANRNVVFGEYPIHTRLTLAQLDELRAARPEIAETQAFVDACLARLAPSPDTLLPPDSREMLDHLTTLRAFADTLGAKFNHVKIPLYRHLLETALSLEKPDLNTFQAYLEMPRNPAPYISDLCRATWRDSRVATVQLNAKISPALPVFPELPPTDAELVDAYLLHFLRDARDTSLFEKWIEPQILARRIAESKLLYAQADAADWSSKLAPEQLQALKDRAEILFPARHRAQFAADEIPELKVSLKNISRLTVKIYDIDAAAFYRGNDRELDTDIDLEGLKPNAEATFTYNILPLQRHTETLAFDELKEPGVYMVEFVGNGIASRALIRKGRLRVAHRTTSAGDLFYVFDENGKPVTDATLSLGSQSYRVNDLTGGILLPFATEAARGDARPPNARDGGRTSPSAATLVFESGRVALRHEHTRGTENYSLILGVLLDTEMIQPGQPITAVLRPQLYVNGTPTDIGLLANHKLTITTTTLDNISTTHTVDAPQLSNTRDFTHSFFVPPRTTKISFSLTGRVRNAASKVALTGADEKLFEDLSADFTTTFNAMQTTDQPMGFVLRRAEEGYYLELRGRNGEAVNGNVRLGITHRLFRGHPHELVCRTENGVIFLGKLADISSMTARYPEGDEHANIDKVMNAPDMFNNAVFTYGYNGGPISQSWTLPVEGALSQHDILRGTLRVLAGSNIILPRHASTREEPVHLHYALYALAGGPASSSAMPSVLYALGALCYVSDETARITLAPNALAISKLPAGEYILIEKSTNIMRFISALDAPQAAQTKDNARYYLTPARIAEASPTEPLRIANIAKDADNLSITLNRAAASTRVHVLARCAQTDNVRAFLDGYKASEPRNYAAFDSAPLFSLYTTGRVMGDEARYIMERRFLPPQIGVMLNRPSLLLAPWSTTETKTDIIDAKGGAEWARARQGYVGHHEGSSAYFAANMADLRGRFSGDRPQSQPLPLDFLETPALLLANLVPENNVVTLPSEQFADYTELFIIAVDATQVDSTTFTLPYTALKTRDLRFKPAFTADEKVTQQRVITTREALAIPGDATITALETFDTLQNVFAYFQALKEDPVFAKFAFLTSWQGLDLATKRRLYNEFACHELNFFVACKDPAFFEAVVKPFIANKRDKQLVDDYLLGNDLAPHTETVKFQQLNTFEKILLARAGHMPGAITRDITDAVALLPPNDDARERAFNTALNVSGFLQPVDMGANLREKGLLAGAPPPSPSRPAAVAGGAAPPPLADAAVGASRAEQSAKEALDDGEWEDYASDASDLFAMEESLRESVSRPLYRSPAVTREWVETHYYQTPLAKINASLVTPSAFWRDAALGAPGSRPADGHDEATVNPRDKSGPGGSPALPGFLPASLADAARSTTERLLALALIDLPETAGREPGAPAIVFAEYATPGDADADAKPLLLVQNMFDLRDRFERGDDGHGQIEKSLAPGDEFFTSRAYGMSVILSNPTGRPRKLRLLASIPEGAIPLKSTRELFARPVLLDAYAIQRFELFFYFPQTGDFPVRPASAAENGFVSAVASPFTCHVRAFPTSLKLTTWQELSRNGTIAQIVAFLETQNLRDPQIDFNLVRFRLLEKDFYTQLGAFLEARFVFDKTVASFAFRHNDLPGVANYITRFAPGFYQSLGPRFASPLLSYDSEVSRAFEHKEYWPLINARAHPLKQQRAIANQSFAAHHAELMDYLVFTQKRSERDTLALVCALLTQDRVTEARAFFATLDRAALPEKMQYDYANAYLNYAGGKLEEAREIAAPYANHPVARWQGHFTELLGHIAEATDQLRAGNALPYVEPEDFNFDDPADVGVILATIAGEKRFDAAVATTPSLTANLAGATLTVHATNVGDFHIRYFPLDIENLFSRAPFLASNPASLGHIRPAHVVTLKGGNAAIGHKIPDDLAAQNLLIEITSPDTPVVRRLSHTPNSMTVNVLEAVGQIRVRANDNAPVAPLPGAYVKVYAQDANGGVAFYKDGYTDPRGAFDYASLSTDTLRGTRRFALLILHPAHGAFITEANPPPR